MLKIPKRIVYVFDKKSPKDRFIKSCIAGWKMVMPDYEIIELNEDNFDYEKAYRNSLFFRKCYDRKLWAYVSDYIRVHALYETGGIYLDTDVQTLKRFDPFLHHNLFIGMQDDYLVEPAIFGVTSKHPFLEKVIHFYQEDIFYQPIFLLPHVFTKLIKDKYHFNGFKDYTSPVFEDEQKTIAIYPEEFFATKQKDSNIPVTTDNTVTIHWESGTWADKDISVLITKHWTFENYLAFQEGSYFRLCDAFRTAAIKMAPPNSRRFKIVKWFIKMVFKMVGKSK